MSPVLFIPHGGGPLPLLGDAGHQVMVDFLGAITANLGQPSAILVISAHWEEGVATITSGKSPSLIYDYYGFPDEAYDVEYPAAGDPILAERIFGLLEKAGIEARMDDHRGFDHGLFVPLKLMYPAASIPCVQLSLINNLDPQTHINIGKALSDLRKENVLIVGSGLSFHNMDAFLSKSDGVMDAKNRAFEDWLAHTCTNNNIPPPERERRLIEWADAPAARYCHPREEHLLPLHVCYGLSNSVAARVFDDKVLGMLASAYLW
ncbi:MAG: dioxygenase [Gammaproteobacteria bacterium]|nr:MAG: dioxygenase [Gammaproteobacteria bacterium]RLA59417.1 MAG: dioxygenase [Gammaproteobacteria bacterium]